MNRVLPAWAAPASYLVVALFCGVAIGIVIAPMPKPMVLLTCPAPLLGAKARVHGTMTIRLDLDTGDENDWNSTTPNGIRDEIIDTFIQDLTTLVSFVAKVRSFRQDLTVTKLTEPGDQPELFEAHP